MSQSFVLSIACMRFDMLLRQVRNGIPSAYSSITGHSGHGYSPQFDGPLFPENTGVCPLRVIQ